MNNSGTDPIAIQTVVPIMTKGRVVCRNLGPSDHLHVEKILSVTASNIFADDDNVKRASDSSAFRIVEIFQRCRVRSDARYGSIHEVQNKSVETVCGLSLFTRSWLYMGFSEARNVTCKACIRLAKTDAESGDAS
jgi:hypothetical protein